MLDPAAAPATSSSTSSSPRCPPGRCRGRRARRGCDRPRGNSRLRRAARRASMSCSISSTGTGGCSSSSRRSARTPRTRSKRSNAARTAAASAVPSSPAVDRRVQRAHEIEQHAERRGGVHVVGDVLVEGTSRLVQPRRSPPGWRRRSGSASRRARKSVSRLSASSACAMRRPRELQLLAIVHAQVEIAQRRRPEARVDDVLQVVDVAERLRHLLARLASSSIIRCSAWNQKRENCLPGRAFALRDLVLVMREDQVDAAGVDVDRRLAEQAQRHRRALDVPAGTARPDAGIPGRLARLGRLPQHEVAGVVLFVLVRVDARAALACRCDRAGPACRSRAASRS